MSNQQKIDDIMNKARHCFDPEKLRDYAAQLQDLGAWNQAYILTNDAKAIERQQAEEVTA